MTDTRKYNLWQFCWLVSFDGVPVFFFFFFFFLSRYFCCHRVLGFRFWRFNKKPMLPEHTYVVNFLIFDRYLHRNLSLSLCRCRRLCVFGFSDIIFCMCLRVSAFSRPQWFSFSFQCNCWLFVRIMYDLIRSLDFEKHICIYI